MTAEPPPGAPRPPRKRALLDVRLIIGTLLGIYGIVLLVVGLTGTSQAELAKADGINVNLWTGIGLVVASAVFLVWARLRPIIVPLEREIEDADRDGPGHG